MTLAPIAAPRLFRRIADTLAAAIDAGEFAPGDRLPGERDLARRLEVSRSSLREALSTLELEGRVEIRMGSGVYVRQRHGRGAARPTASAGSASPFDVLRARRLVEAEAAALAARHATPAQLRAIEQAFERLSADMRANRAHSEGDRLFHERIAQASGNTALAMVVAQLWECAARSAGHAHRGALRDRPATPRQHRRASTNPRCDPCGGFPGGTPGNARAPAQCRTAAARTTGHASRLSHRTRPRTT